MMSLQKKLLFWYKDNRRDLPWRKSKDPYKVWLSEIILQQTRAAQGLPYFLKFENAFPTVQSLAEAEEEEVLKLWQGLGYYSRARNLHFTAQTIVNDFNGIFPNEFKKLKSLKGIGDYTASAIGSICFDLPEAVVDGNVYRMLSRIFALSIPIDSSPAHKVFKDKANLLMKGASPGEFNQAMMEFGALQCLPRNPNCGECVFSSECIAYQQGKVSHFPIKSKKIKVRKRYFNYLVLINSDGKTLIEKRIGAGIWQNLYQFPLLETNDTNIEIDENDVSSFLNHKGIQQIQSVIKYNDLPITHKLTHQHLEIIFWIVETTDLIRAGVKSDQLDDYPMPKALQNFREKFFMN